MAKTLPVAIERGTHAHRAVPCGLVCALGLDAAFKAPGRRARFGHALRSGGMSIVSARGLCPVEEFPGRAH